MKFYRKWLRGRAGGMTNERRQAPWDALNTQHNQHDQREEKTWKKEEAKAFFSFTTDNMSKLCSPAFGVKFDRPIAERTQFD